ncbi:tape measure protein [Aeromonas hydrophila]|uniref:tape measure protein n=1 Tax=Aeromonas hydrophila TaxID=644 RepID=UPI001C5BC95B|nr:tape measure protein [Aeromonas hydrophila]MBW3795336.1 tape measure protein [Aeromonas hydrophila]MBW3801272.1 tape measure protein [Aeromonas hydrophila]MBW3817366.1 tape measure protein [Aeromonas hydrophila]
MSTSSTLKLALELAAKVTGREDLAALAGEVQELGPISDETAAETEHLAQTLESLSQQQALIQQFNDAKAALTQLELATVQSRDKLTQLRAEQQAGSGDAKALADQERLLASEVRQLERQLVSQAASHTRLHAGLTQVGLDTRNLGQEQQRLQRELAQTVAQTERLGRELSQGSQRANGFQGAIGSLTGHLVALAGTWFGIQTLTTQLMAMFQTGDQAERLDVQLKAVMGSIAGGKEASAWIQDFAKNTPLQLSEVTQVFVRLKAFGIDPMNGAMQGIIDQAYKLGGGFEEVQGISLALGQAWAKQKLQGEEILQLIERGVPVWQLLEQVTGKNTAELQKLSEAGKLGRDTISALMNEIAAQSSGAAANNMSLLSGLISNAQDNLAKFYRMVAENGVLTWLKNQLASLNREFDQMAQDGRLQAWAKRLSDGFITLGETLKSLIQALYEWRTALTVLAQAWVGLKIVGWIGDLRSLYAQFIALPTATATAAGGMTTAGTVAAGAAIGVRALGAAVRGLLAAVTVEAIIQITQFAAALRQLVQAELALREARTLRSETLARLNGQFAALSAELGVAITSMADLDRLVAEGKVHYDDATGSWRQGAAAVKALGDEAKQTRDYLVEINAVAKQTAADGPGKLAKAFDELGLDFERANGRIGAGFQKTLGALDVLVQHTGASSAAIEEALASAYNSAKTKAEIDGVIERQKQLAAQGKITGDALARSMAIATDAMSKVKGGSGEAKKAVAAIGDGFDDAAARAKGATDAMRAGLKGVQSEAEQTHASLSSGGGGGSGNTRTVNAGSFYYKSVDINSLRGNAEGLANTLAGVEEELARYSQKVKDIPAYSEWSKYYGEKFQKEMEVMRAQLKAELSKAQEVASQTQGAAPPPVQSPSPTSASPGDGRRPATERITIELKGAGGSAELQADEANAHAFINLLKQQGLRS